jgi:hypothetical protein
VKEQKPTDGLQTGKLHEAGVAAMSRRLSIC